jgi:flagellar hook-basal body complex protein FliE
MEKKILKYKMFDTSEDFEQWQKDNENVTVSNVTPVITNMAMDVSETQTTAETQAKAFVLYWGN